MNNAHVILYFRLRCLQAERQRRFMAQWYWYTQAMQEADPDWRPY